MLTNDDSVGAGRRSVRNDPAPDPILSGARLLLKYGAVDGPERLLELHVADGYGKCRGCRTQMRTPLWPCPLVAIAHRARELSHGR